MTISLLNIHDLSIGYQTPIRDHLTLSIETGEFVCLLGPNGSGKSTLLKTILGLQAPLSGEMTLFDKDLTKLYPQERAQLISAVLTERVQTDHLTAIDLVLLGRFPHRHFWSYGPRSDHHIAEEALERVGATPLQHRRVETLSDGERQRVFLARALAQDASLLILDEPTSYLDLPQKIDTFHVLKRWCQKQKRAVFMSSHDLDLSISLADRLILFGPHSKIYTGTPEDLILSGQFQEVFEGDHLSIDYAQGRIEVLPTGHLGPIQLSGDHNKLGWTRRALLRSGFQPCANASIRVNIDTDHWTLITPARSSQHDTIDALLRELKGCPFPE